MIKSLAIALAISLPMSASAAVLLPNTFARVYCQSRQMGMDEDSATKQAVAESIIHSQDGTPVTYGGVDTTTDVVAAYRESRLRCPQYFS